MATREDTTKEENGTTTDNIEGDDTTMKGILYNNKAADLITTTLIIKDNRKIITTIDMEEDTTQNIIENMKRMTIQDKNKDTETRNTTDNILTGTTNTTNIMTTTTEDTMKTMRNITPVINTNIEVNKREEEDTIMADAIELFQNTEIYIAQEEQGEDKDVDKSYNNKKIKNNNITKTAQKKSKKNQKLKIDCMNVRGMNKVKKQGNIRTFLGKEKWDVAIITETKLKEQKGKFIYKGWNQYECINSSYCIITTIQKMELL
ncbi:hypothetical protein C1646_772823 [Rhizophagus diaphanus]|nr:hypothetical protein C1646_772823 [Rhizophagus diaphanus] [Rhizophagus sp. MUCL 43196]